jgi:hypothetical protein
MVREDEIYNTNVDLLWCNLKFIEKSTLFIFPPATLYVCFNSCSFICGLFKDAVNSTDVAVSIAWAGRIINE